MLTIVLAICAALLSGAATSSEIRAAHTQFAADMQTASGSSTAGSQDTLSVLCGDKEQSRTVTGPTSSAPDGRRRAYVEVTVNGGSSCSNSTALWLAQTPDRYRVIYLMSPKQELSGNGMRILGWSNDSKMLLVRTDEWQYGSDAADVEGVIAIDTETGMVHQPDLEVILRDRKEKQCRFRVTQAGFRAGTSLTILVRVHLSPFYEVDEESVPARTRCSNSDETWSFNLGTGEVRQVGNTEPLAIYGSRLSGGL